MSDVSREEFEETKRWISDVEKQQETTVTVLQKIDKTVDRISTVVLGVNGFTGLADLMKDIQVWVKNHPQVCPLPQHVTDTVNTPKETKNNIWLVLSVVTAIAFGVAGIVVGVLALRRS